MFYNEKLFIKIMKNFTKRNQIILLNIVIVGLSTYALYEDYIAKGKIQWIDPNDDDGDEFGFNIITFGIIVMGVFSILYQILDAFIFSLKDSNRFSFFEFFFNIANTIYGLLGLVLGAFLSMSSLSMFLQGNETVTIGISFLLFGICFTYLGYLTIKQITNNQKVKIVIKEEQILDEEIG
jgi:hypothetical protein